METLDLDESAKLKATSDTSGQADQIVIRKCATCGKESPALDMKTCMDHRQMHRYVCDSKCMMDFYA